MTSTEARIKSSKSVTESRKAAAASTIGSVFEWYDFFVYGLLAALVFNKVFFPELDGATGTLASLSTFTVGFIGRPLGAAFFGHFGDKLGRKAMMMLTLTGMGGATLLIGFLPTYASVGLWAPVLLVLLRFLQGVALGGEWGGTSLFTIEHAPEGRRGFFGALPQMGIPGGQLLATVIVLAVTGSVSQEAMLDWGWRIPFLLSSVLLALGIAIRFTIRESPDFERLKESGDIAKRPLMELLRGHLKNVLLVAGMHLGMSAAFFVGTVLVVSYATTEIKVPQTTVLVGVALAQAAAVVALPFVGKAADKYGLRRMYFVGSLGVAVTALPYFALVRTGVPGLIWLALIMGALAFVPMMAVQPAFFAQLFDARVRYSGVAIGYQLGTVAGSFTPIIAAVLLSAGNHEPWLVAGYLAVVGVISFASAYLAKETGRAAR